jgi:hypothetical protein
MSSRPDPTEAAFQRLARRLLVRRLMALEPTVRFALAAIAAIGAGLVFWQARLPLHGVVLADGAPAGARLLAGVLAALAAAAALSCGATAGWLARRRPGPEWLALPASPARIGRHLLFEARLPSALALPAGLAAVAAGAGLLPGPWLGLLLAAFVLAWLEGTRLGAAIAWRVAARRSGVPGGQPLFVRVLAAGPPRTIELARTPPRWRRAPRWHAVAAKDRLLLMRSPALRTRLTIAFALVVLAGAAWTLPQPALVRAALSFAAYLAAMGTLGLLAGALVGGDPPAFWRPLPLRLADGWRARALGLAIAALALPVANAALAAGLSAPARAGVALFWWPAGVLVSGLALHHALTLYPESRVASSVTTSWYSVAAVASLMIPLLGWIVLLAGFIHATRRLARGFRSDTR